MAEAGYFQKFMLCDMVRFWIATNYWSVASVFFQFLVRVIKIKIDFFCRVYLKDTDSQSQGVPCVLQKFNKDGSLSDESPGLMVRCDVTLFLYVNKCISLFGLRDGERKLSSTYIAVLEKLVYN